jgi:hypothetical protein
MNSRMHARTHARTHTRTHAHKHTHSHAGARTRACACAHTHTHTCLRIQAHACRPESLCHFIFCLSFRPSMMFHPSVHLFVSVSVPPLRQLRALPLTYTPGVCLCLSSIPQAPALPPIFSQSVPPSLHPFLTFSLAPSLTDSLPAFQMCSLRHTVTVTVTVTSHCDGHGA